MKGEVWATGSDEEWLLWNLSAVDFNNLLSLEESHMILPLAWLRKSQRGEMGETEGGGGRKIERKRERILKIPIYSQLVKKKRCIKFPFGTLIMIR